MEWRVQEQGPRAVIEVWKADKKDGLYKAWAVGTKGRCLLGTLMPEGGRLYLRRTLSVDSLRRQGVWPVQQVEEELAFSVQEQKMSIEWEDEVLCRCARNLPRYTLRREGDGFSLIFPFDPRSPFPLLPVFCFGRVKDGHLIFSFRKGGLPNSFHDPGNHKKET